MDNSSPSMLRATLISGAAFGVLGGIPIVGCLCCAWMMGAGFLAAYLYSNQVKAAGAEFRPGNGAVIGLVAAMFYSLAATVVGAVFSSFTGPPDLDEIIDQMEQGGAPPEVVDMVVSVMERLTGPPGRAGRVLRYAAGCRGPLHDRWVDRRFRVQGRGAASRAA